MKCPRKKPKKMNSEKLRVTILDCPVDALTMQETIELIDKSIAARNPLKHVVVNAAKLVNMRSDEALKKSVINSDIINADGQSVVWASRFLGHPLPERVAGIDIMEKLAELSYRKGYRIFFFGAHEEIVKKTVSVFSERYSHSIVAGYRNGYFTQEEEPSIAEMIGSSNPDILFVAISSPKKEIFLEEYKDVIKVPFVMGVGGSFDVVAGFTKRAPLWMQKSGMEWFYRLIQEPGRMWKRYLITNTLFIYYVLKEKIKLPFVKRTKN